MTTITNAGYEAQIRMLAGLSPPAAFLYIGTGSGTGAESASDTALGSENTQYGGERAEAVREYIEPGGVRWSRKISFTGDVTIQELGIFNAASGGDMFLRVLLEAATLYHSSDVVEIVISYSVSS